MSDKTQLLIRITEYQKELLKIQCKNKGITISEYIRRLIDNDIKYLRIKEDSKSLSDFDKSQLLIDIGSTMDIEITVKQ